MPRRSQIQDRLTQDRLAQWERTARRLCHKGHDVAYHCEGAGPALLLLHGFPTSSFDYGELWSPLCEQFRVLAFDMLGFGFSDKPVRYAYGIADQADIAEELCGALGVTRCQLLCHDVGDTVGQELLARQREGTLRFSIERALFLNGGLFPETHRATRLQTELLGPAADEVARRVTREGFFGGIAALWGSAEPSDALLEALWAQVSRADGVARWPQLIRYIEERSSQRERWVGALVQAGVPLRVVVGALDPVSGRHMAERYLELIPNPDCVLLDDVGHFPPLEAPASVLEQALSFFVR